EGSRFPRQRMPERPGVAFAHIFQETLVKLGWKRAWRRWTLFKMQVVGMNDDERHPAVPRDPVELLKPNIRVALTEQQEQGRVLRQRVGKLDVTRLRATAPTGHPKRKDGIHPVRLRFERVGVKGRSIVTQLQVMEPIELMKHRPGTKAHRFPVLKI